MKPKADRTQQAMQQAKLAYNTDSNRAAFCAGVSWADHTHPKAVKDMELNHLRKQLTDIATRLEFLYGIKLSNAHLDYTDGSVSGVRFIYSEWDICEYKRVEEE